MQRSHKANKQNSEVLTRLNYCDLIWIRLTIRHNMAGREGRLNRIFRVGLLVLKKVKEYPYKKIYKTQCYPRPANCVCVSTTLSRSVCVCYVIPEYLYTSTKHCEQPSFQTIYLSICLFPPKKKVFYFSNSLSFNQSFISITDLILWTWPWTWSKTLCLKIAIYILINVYSSPKNLSYKFIKYLEQSTKAIVEWSTS